MNNSDHSHTEEKGFRLPRACRAARTWIRLAVVVLCWYQIFPPAIAAALAYNLDSLQSAMQSRFPRSSTRILGRLDVVIAAARQEQDETDKLVRINDFFNQRILFEDDRVIWQQEDYWATPLETLAIGRGDCEDIAIAKYYALKAAGVDVAKMRLVYVRATIEGPGGPRRQAHMVVAYYPAPNAEPLILDNLDGNIRPANQRRDLLPVFSFNSEAVWAGVAGDATRESGSGQLSRWRDLQDRSRAEGFE